MTRDEEAMLEYGLKLGEEHLNDKLKLLSVMELALAQLKRGKTKEAQLLMERVLARMGLIR